MPNTSQEESVIRLSTGMSALPTTDMQDDPKRAARHGIDRLGKDIEAFIMQDRAQEEEVNRPLC